MLLFFCIAYQVIHGIVIILRIVVSCDIVGKICLVYGHGTVSWTRPVAENNVDGNTNRGPGFLGASLSPLPSTNENINYDDSLAKGPTVQRFPRSHGSTDPQKILLIAKLNQAKPMHR